MKYIIIFLLLLLPLTSAIAVTPTTASDSFLVINNLDEKAEYIIKSGVYEKTISLNPNEKIKLNLTSEFSDEIYIYEIQKINGLGVINSVKIPVDQEKDQRLNLDEVKIAKPLSLLWLLLILIPIAAIILIKKYKKA